MCAIGNNCSNSEDLNLNKLCSENAGEIEYRKLIVRFFSL